MLKKLYVFLQNNEYIVKSLNIASVFYSCIIKIFTIIVGISLAREIFYLSLSLADLSHFGVDNCAVFVYQPSFFDSFYNIFTSYSNFGMCGSVYFNIFMSAF